MRDLELGINVKVEVLICGGAPEGSYIKAKSGDSFMRALDTCGRININDPNPTWILETMPMDRVMGDMVYLPNADLLIINGAGAGTADLELGRDPVLNPVIYHPDGSPGSRFEIQNPTQIPRMYHSCAVLLRDGRVLVSGSNPHDQNNFTTNLYPTELRLEAFSPSYLDPINSEIRPVIISPNSHTIIHYGESYEIQFRIDTLINNDGIKITMIRPPFNTHFLSMSQRLLVLTNTKPKNVGLDNFQVEAIAPGFSNIAPPGFYMLFVVHKNIPSEGIWVQLLD